MLASRLASGSTSRVFLPHRVDRSPTSETGIEGNRHSMSSSVAAAPNRTAKTARAIRRQASSPPSTIAQAEVQELMNLAGDVHDREVAKVERRCDERVEPVASELDRLR